MKNLVFFEQILKITTFLSGFVLTFTYHQDFLPDPYLYKTLSNRFYKTITSTKLITSINSTIKMYRFQKNRLFGAQLSSTLISFDDEPPLKDIIYLNLHA